MPDQVDEIKAKIDIVSLIGEQITLKKAGRNYKALCPFHSEKTPSFMVSPELQIFKCFGCGEAGDAIAFLQKYEGVDFYESLKFLAERAGVKLTPRITEQKGEKEELYQINTLASRFYHYLLVKHFVGEPALEYLTKARGLKNETISEFNLGYSPDKPLALKSFLVDKKKISLRDLEKAGIIYLANGRPIDRFRGRIVFPLYDHRGNVAGFAGRILPKDENKELAKYINTPETPIYHKSSLLYGFNLTKQEVKRKNEAVVVEGELDLISCWQIGIKNTVAIKGSALTPEQARLLGRFTQKVILALDTDLAGDAAARRGISVAEGEGLEVKVAVLSGFKDPDEAAKKDPNKFKQILQHTVGVWDFLMNSIFSHYDEKTGEGKAKISREIIPILGGINDEIIRAHYADLVAKRLGVPLEAVIQEISKNLKGKGTISPVVIESKVHQKGRRDLLEDRLLAIAFRLNPKILLETELADLVSTPRSRRILQEYQNYTKTNKTFDPSHFAGRLPKELTSGFVDIILKEFQGLESDVPEMYQKELELVKRELKIINLKEKLARLAEMIRQFEQAKEKGKLKKAEKEFTTLTKNLTDLEGSNHRGIILSADT